MLDGRMRHEDTFGNRGDLGPGDVQWMTAGARHHPLRDAAADGRAHARLPAVDQPAGAREDEARGVSRHSRRARSRPWRSTGAGSCGSLPGASASRASRPRGRSAACRPSRCITTCGCRPTATAVIPTPRGHNAFLYVYEGDAVVGEDARPLPFRAAGLLTPGDAVRIEAGEAGVQAAAACRQADRRAGGPVRSVRDELGAGDRARDRRLPVRSPGRRELARSPYV